MVVTTADLLRQRSLGIIRQTIHSRETLVQGQPTDKVLTRFDTTAVANLLVSMVQLRAAERLETGPKKLGK